MRIEIEPKSDGMHHVNFLFSEQAPDPEDAWVRQCLEGFPVPPRRLLRWELDGVPYQVLQYGECIIGEALYFLDRYKRVVDRIRSVCPELDGVECADAHDVITETAHEFEGQARLTMGMNGEMSFSVDDAALRERVLERLAETR